MLGVDNGFWLYNGFGLLRFFHYGFRLGFGCRLVLLANGHENGTCVAY